MNSGPSRVDHYPPSESDDSDSRDSEGWNDAEDDEEETPEVISLLDDRVFPDVMSMLAHCKEKHSFDFLGIRQKLQLDFHGCVKLVNFSESLSHAILLIFSDFCCYNISSSSVVIYTNGHNGLHICQSLQAAFRLLQFVLSLSTYI